MSLAAWFLGNIFLRSRPEWVSVDLTPSIVHAGFDLSWQDVTDISVTGMLSDERYHETRGSLAHPVAGKDRTGTDPAVSYLTISTANGDAIFENKGLTAPALQARVSPVLRAFERVKAARAPTASPDTATTPTAPPVPAPQVSVADELMKLAKLRDSGVLSEEEFLGEKQKLLGRS